MTTLPVAPNMDGFRVIHPLDDAPEEKCSSAGLGKMKMTRAVRVSLGILRAYLIVMTLMLVYHVLDLSGFLQRGH